MKKQKIINTVLIIFLVIFPFYLASQLYLLDKVYFLCPVDYGHGDIIIRSDSYGSGEFFAKRNGSRRHNGIDLQADKGTPVYAAMGGKVLNAEFHRGLGNYVEILHKGGYITIYGHLSRIDVRGNQLVRQGDKIGEVGKTGNANSRGLIPHLHFEIRIGTEPIDPTEFLPR